MPRVNQKLLESVQATDRRCSARLRGDQPDFVVEPPPPTKVRTRPPPVRQILFKFMNLPRELRNHIYHVLWQNTPRVGGFIYTPPDTGSQHHFSFRFSFSYDSPITKVSSVKGLPKWILTSRFILKEGMEQLCIKSVVETTSKLDYAIDTPLLFNPTLIKSLIFNGRLRQKDNQLTSHGFQDDHRNDHRLPIIVQNFKNLTHLTLWFDIYDTDPQSHKPYALDLSSLEAGSLKLQMLCVVMFHLFGHGDDSIPPFCEEITRVGRIVVKGNGEEKLVHKKELVIGIGVITVKRYGPRKSRYIKKELRHLSRDEYFEKGHMCRVFEYSKDGKDEY